MSSYSVLPKLFAENLRPLFIFPTFRPLRGLKRKNRIG